MSRADHIRGIYASASLKRPRDPSLRGAYWRYPRHLRLGLIEAVARGLSTNRDEIYPRHLRLGLIEATHSIASTAEVRDIRGIYASASLKRPVPDSGESPAPHIRGIYASASLKLRSIPSSHPIARHIRGIYASASLKLLIMGLRLRKRDVISEAFTPRPH